MRIFHRPMVVAATLREAVVAHASRTGEKLRAHGLVAGRLAAFVYADPHSMGGSTTALARLSWRR